MIGKNLSWNLWAFIFWCCAMGGFALIRIGSPVLGEVMLSFGIFAGGFCVLRSIHHYFFERKKNEG